jgi:hypothetical protein
VSYDREDLIPITEAELLRNGFQIDEEGDLAVDSNFDVTYVNQEYQVSIGQLTHYGETNDRWYLTLDLDNNNSWPRVVKNMATLKAILNLLGTAAVRESEEEEDDDE